MRNYVSLCALLVCSSAVQNCSSQLEGLLAALDNSTSALRIAAEAARASGIDTTYENVTLAIATLFASTIVPADAANLSSNGVGDAYASWLEDSEMQSPAYVANALAELPCNETQGAIESVASAAERLAIAVANASTRRPTPPFSLLTTHASFSPMDGLLHAADGGAVVYASSYCFALCPIGFPEAQLFQPQSIPGAHDMHYEWLVLSDTLLPGPGLGVNMTEATRIAASAARYQTEHGLRTHIFIDQRFLPTWADTAFPGVQVG